MGDFGPAFVARSVASYIDSSWRDGQKVTDELLVRVVLTAPGLSGVTEPMLRDDADLWIGAMRVAYPDVRCRVAPLSQPVPDAGGKHRRLCDIEGHGQHQAGG